MRKTLLLPIVLAASALAVPALHAQNLANMVTKRLPLASDQGGISTSIKDALPVETHLASVDELTPLPLPEDFNFGPGYYRGNVRSYCLHAGTYGPTTGDGYLLAPLKGKYASIIRGVLTRSAQHPQIAQVDVQRLIWAVESSTGWDRLDSGLRSRVAPLMSTQDIALLSTESVRKKAARTIKGRLGKLIPGGAQKVVNELDTWSGRLASMDVPFDELERMAVLTGDAPWGEGSRRDVGPGNWVYVGDGFYLRTFTRSYEVTTLEVFRTGTADIARDDLGRITRFDSDGYVIDTRYAPGDTPQVVDGVPAWRLSEITFRHPDGRSHTIRNKGHVTAQAAPPGGGAASPMLAMALQASAAWMGDLPPPKGDLGDMKHYEDGLKSATDPNDFKGRTSWLLEHFSRVKATWLASADALAGRDGDPPGPEKRRYDPSSHVATPANTSKQRVGLSTRQVPEY